MVNLGFKGVGKRDLYMLAFSYELVKVFLVQRVPK